MSNPLYTNLPERYLSDAPNLTPSSSFVEDFVQKTIPRHDGFNLKKDLQWQFLLDKHAFCKNKTHRPIQKKKKFLTRKERQKLNILKLPKTDWDYKSLGQMRRMWRQYMRQNLELAGKAPQCQDQDWTGFATIVARSELVGSEVKVVRAKVPSLVGLSGTVVLETKMTMQIVTSKSQLKTIPKSTAVFEFMLDQLRFTVFGKHIMTKPSERSVKKIKTQMLPDL